MTPRPTRNQRDRQRLDPLIARPLGSFRRTLPRLSVDELHALQARIGVLTVGARWARGSSHGLARHRVPNELGRLARRDAAIRLELAARQIEAPALRLVDSAPLRTLDDRASDRQAA